MHDAYCSPKTLMVVTVLHCIIHAPSYFDVKLLKKETFVQFTLSSISDKLKIFNRKIWRKKKRCVN